MAVSPLPTENYTILLMSGVLSIIYFIVGLFAFKLDKDELNKCKVIFFQDNIKETDILYSVTLTTKGKLCMIGTSDLIFRLRGSNKDGPLVLYRDLEGTKFNEGASLNIGLALPFRLGNLFEVDLAADNDCSEEGEPVVSISDIYARELPRWNVTGCKRNLATSLKRRASAALFTSLATDLLAWVCLDTITNTSGAGIVGIQTPQNGRNQTLRSRDVALSLPFTREDPNVKKRAKVRYLPLHYLFAMSSKWHDSWSDFSRLDLVLVMFLDQITCLVVVSASFAYQMDRTFGVQLMQSLLKPSLPSIEFVEITEFNLYRFINEPSLEWTLRNTMSFIHVLWIALIGSLLIIPLSLVWCRLFRFIGGKEFDQIYNRVFHGKPKDESKPSYYAPPTGTYGVLPSTNTNLMLRTLECRSVHTGSSVTSSRQLRVEPIICNCLPDNITARSVAYVRTKMARLRDDEIGGTGTSELKSPKVLHESHTQSTDAPQMPPPSSAPDGSGEVIGVARYCERLVQQASQHIRDKSVIAECFEVAPESVGGGGSWQKSCCPRQCCKRNLRCRDQSFSNATFFTEEDAASVKEMISSFSLRQIPEAPNKQSAEKFRCIYGNQFNLNQRNRKTSELELQSTEAAERITSSVYTRRRGNNQLNVSAAPTEKRSEVNMDSAPAPSGRKSKSSQNLLKLTDVSHIVNPKPHQGMLKSAESTQSLKSKSKLRHNAMKPARSNQNLRARSKSHHNLSKDKESSEQERSKANRSSSKPVEAQHFSKSKRKYKNSSVGETLDENRKSKSSSNIFQKSGKLIDVNENSETDGNVWIGRKATGHQRSVLKESNIVPTSSKHRSTRDLNDVSKTLRHRVSDSSQPRKHSSRTTKAKQKDATKNQVNKVPFPSGFQDSSSCSMVEMNKAYDPDTADAIEAKDFKNRRKVPFKGTKFKIIAFLILTTVQLTELYFVTAFISPSNNKFFELESGRPPSAGLMHAAVVSCLVSLVLYFILTVHLIAFFSYLIELSMLWWYANHHPPLQAYLDQPIYML